MPVKLRLQRHGRKARPFYHIVAADSRAPRDGRFIEKIGSFNPIGNQQLVLDSERALYWLQNGAQPTDKVRAMLSSEGVMFRNHLLVGVRKGALTQEQADAKFEAWMQDKEGRTGKKLDGIRKKLEDAKAKALSNEKDIAEKRAAAIAAAQAEAEAAANAVNAEAEQPAGEDAEAAPAAEEGSSSEAVAE